MIFRTHLGRDESGAAIIELALVAPILALMTVGVVDMSNAFSRKLALEQGAQRAIEKIMQTTETGTVENTLAAEAVCQVNGTNANGSCKSSPISVSDVTVSFRLECSTAGTITSTSTTTDSTVFDATDCASTEKEARYIQVSVNDKYTPLFPVHFVAFNGDGTYHISAVAGMRTK